MATHTDKRGSQWRGLLSRGAGKFPHRAYGIQVKRQICALAEMNHGFAKACTSAGERAFATEPTSSAHLFGPASTQLSTKTNHAAYVNASITM